ncbi:hypothetical protein [uncultured Desulfobacter sp.]|uniref:hypothetical protein n=1 Tax=uncultured Desulfobacter sp. TaxID=240139 RepID=UPI002AABF750|nr:hypothetical protein [uncultured Desulfobacter sp.]
MADTRNQYIFLDSGGVVISTLKTAGQHEESDQVIKVDNVEGYIGKKRVDGVFVDNVSDSSQLTILEFRNRFTFAEKVALKSSTDAGVQVFIDDLSVAQYVDLSDENLIAGMGYLVDQGLITEARSTEILTA